MWNRLVCLSQKAGDNGCKKYLSLESRRKMLLGIHKYLLGHLF